MEEWEKTAWFKSQHSITPILHSLIYGKGTGIEIKGRRRCAGVFGGDQRRRKRFARRFQRQERRAVFLSEGRHAGLRDHFAGFRKKGAVVFGVSTDPVKSHDKFVKKFKLPFPLLADEDKKIVAAYGVWGEKNFMGRKYLGTHRVTFLIGPDGRIKKIWPQVKPDEHAEEVLAML